MGKTVSTFSQSPLIGSLSNSQVRTTGIKSWMIFNLGQVGLFTTELFALEHFHWLWMGKMVSASFPQLLWIQSSSNLQVMRTGIKSWTDSNFGRILSVILELSALEWWKKWCLQLFSVTFDWIFVKLAGNEDRHKSSNEFEFGSDRIIDFGVICPLAWIFLPISMEFFPPWTYNGENNVSTCYQLPWIQSSSNLQLTRTGMECWTGWIPTGSDQSLWSYMPLSCEKMMSLASLSPLR